jgi:nitroimidazol reductase NimA-like FMN-containing flavoprotein (pyridoxamine 5'-phosphate oxidase superfamily)
VDERTEIVQRVRALLVAQRYAALCTQGDGAPYASLVAFAASDDLRHLVFATMRASRKFVNLTADPRVAVLVDNRSNQETDLGEAIATTATGRATEVLGVESARVKAMLLARHPHLTAFVNSPGCAVVRVEVDIYHTVTRFQNVYELHVGADQGVARAGAQLDPPAL